MDSLSDYRTKAITLLGEANDRRRSEERYLVEYLMPIILGIIGAVIASLSSSFILKNIEGYLCFLKIGFTSLGLSFFIGILYLVKESRLFMGDETARAMQHIDQSEAEGKPNSWHLALAELTTRRNLHKRNNKIPEELRNKFKEAFEIHKDELHSWKTVKNPEKFYSTRDKVLVSILHKAFFASSVFGCLVVIIIYLLIL